MINVLLRVVKVFVQFYIGKIDGPGSSIPRALMVLLMLLNYNLANFENSVEKSSDFRVTLQEPVVELLLTILGDVKLNFLHGLVCFIMVDSFAVLFANPTENMCTVFATLYNRIFHNPTLFVYLIEQVRCSKELPYVVSSRTCRDLFHPVISSLIQRTTIGSHAEEFLDCYLRSLMIELRAVYTEYPQELPPRQRELFHTFVSLLSLISEHIPDFFRGLEDVNAPDLVTHPFVQFYGKWLTMLQPFTSLSRMGPAASYLQSVFTQMAKKVLDEWKLPLLPASGEPHFMTSLFFETFSLYTDFMTSILDGGQEMKDAARYHWLIGATQSSHLEPSKLDAFEQKLETEGLNELRQGFSFTIVRGTSYSVRELESFVRRIAQVSETEGSEGLRKFICDRNRNVRGLDAAQKRVERNFLSALVKQLGVSAELYNVHSRLQKGEKGVVIPPTIESIRNAVLTVRPRLQLSRQKTAERRADGHTGEPRSLEEDYPGYCKAIIQKCVFLLHVQPCLRQQGRNFAVAFQKVLGQLKDFVVAPLTFLELYKTIEGADRARAQVATGIALVNHVFTFNQPLIISHVVNKLSSSTFLIDFLSALNVGARVPLGQITTFLSNVAKFLGSQAVHTSRNSVIVLASTLVLAFAKIDPHGAETAFIDLTKQVVAQQSAIFIPHSQLIYLRSLWHFVKKMSNFLNQNFPNDSQPHFQNQVQLPVILHVSKLPLWLELKFLWLLP
jgi:hypothetical protein